MINWTIEISLELIPMSTAGWTQPLFLSDIEAVVDKTRTEFYLPLSYFKGGYQRYYGVIIYETWRQLEKNY